jgi:hypothetical protein
MPVTIPRDAAFRHSHRDARKSAAPHIAAVIPRNLGDNRTSVRTAPRRATQVLLFECAITVRINTTAETGEMRGHAFEKAAARWIGRLLVETPYEPTSFHVLCSLRNATLGSSAHISSSVGWASCRLLR